MKIRPLKYIIIFCLAWAVQFSTPVDTFAQCPMCRMTAESNLKNGGTAGKGLNKGILYMLVTPYLLIGGLAYVWYRNRKEEEMDKEVK